MKKLLFIPAFIAALFTSCSQDVITPEEEGEKVMLTVNIPGIGQTRATGVTAGGEATISTVQVFVFGTNGVLENYVKESSSVVKVGVASGTKNIYAVVNAADLTAITSESALKAYETNLSDNAVNRFVMFGSKLSEPVSASNNNIVVSVSRVVSKVVVRQIKRAFTNPILGAQSMSIDAIYLTDVAGNAILDNALLGTGKPAGQIWYNKLKNNSECSALLFDSVGLSLPDGSTYSTEHSFYPYPNAESAKPSGSAAGSWSARSTMLVIEATLNGAKTYYPVYLPSLQSNRVYIIDTFTLTRPGSDHPWLPVEDDAVSFTITPEPWQPGGTWNETI